MVMLKLFYLIRYMRFGEIFQLFLLKSSISGKIRRTAEKEYNFILADFF